MGKLFFTTVLSSLLVLGCNAPSNNDADVLNTEELIVASETVVKGQRLPLVDDQPIKNDFGDCDGTGIAQLCGQLQGQSTAIYMLNGCHNWNCENPLRRRFNHRFCLGCYGLFMRDKTNNGVIAKTQKAMNALH